MCGFVGGVSASYFEGVLEEWFNVARLEIVEAVMEALSCLCGLVGQRIRSSRWKRSHQKGSDLLTKEEWMIASIILACSIWKRFLLFFWRRRRQVDRKWGGSWS